MSNWTLFSNHGHVLVCLASDSQARLRDVAADVGITERAVQKIVRDLQTSGMISVSKHGRRNRYRIHHKKALRHELEAHCTLGDLLKLVIHNKPESRAVRNDRSVEPIGVNVEAASVVPAAPEVVAIEATEVKPAKSTASDSKERQQGSLF